MSLDRAVNLGCTFSATCCISGVASASSRLKKYLDPRKQPALTDERHDRIIEGRLGWIVYDRVDFGTRHSDRGIERRFVIGHPDPSNGGVSCGVFHSASKGLFVSISGSWATGIVWSAHPAAKAVKNVITIFFIG